jgi:hypothetical protein
MLGTSFSFVLVMLVKCLAQTVGALRLKHDKNVNKKLNNFCIAYLNSSDFS